MKKLCFLFIISFSLFIFSCKDKVGSNTPENAIKKLTMSDAYGTYSTVVKYNDWGRAIKFEYFEEVNNLPSGYAKFFYNSEGKVQEIVEYDEDGQQTYKETYSYSNNQLTAISSYREEDWIEEDKYTIYYNLNGLIEKYEEFEMEYDSWYKSDSCTYIWDNEDLIQKKYYYTDTYKKKSLNDSQKRLSKTKRFRNLLVNHENICNKHLGSKGNMYATSNFEYSTTLNPFWSLNVVNIWEPESIMIYSKHNATSSTKIYDDSNTYTTTYTYEYNSENYPSKIEVESDIEGTMEIKFEYY